jgi:Tol biopolymer transport system component
MRKIIIHIFLIILLLPFSISAQKPATYAIRKMPFNQNFISDISPVMIDNGILFCSNRRASSIIDRTSFDGRRLYNIYITEKIDSTSWTRPRMLGSERKGLFNNGPVCISADGKTVYFTSETETGQSARNRKFRNRNGIFIASMTGDELTSIRPFPYNSPDYEIAHPSISHDGKFLYFASDMPGGQGGSDIWRAEIVNGEWSKPVNLGPKINTPGTESYPFIHPSGKLFFTSNRPGGFGGLDVYYTAITNNEWEEPVCLAEPVNSADDDFALTATEDQRTGYFSSNRSADDDIFMFSSTVIRKVSCDEMVENSYCFRFTELNAIKYDSIPFVYRWKFGDGESAEGAEVEHCYSGPGTYLVQLDVLNLVTKELITNEKNETLVITDAVQAYINGPDSALAGQTLLLDAKSTNLPGWNIEQYYWNFGDESIDTGAEVSKVFRKPGNYNVQLIVTSVPLPGGVARETCVSKNIVISGSQ